MLTEEKQAMNFLIQGFLTTFCSSSQWTTPPSPRHLPTNSVPTAQLKELANLCAAELHFTRRPIPEHCAFRPVQDVTVLYMSHVTEVAEKSLEGTTGGLLVSVPMTQCLSNLIKITHDISEVFVAWIFAREGNLILCLIIATISRVFTLTFFSPAI